ncbi:hypothetical protein MLD38_037247 [Melastoma candidum]|uniref:Uncharacterized protein n=1 Tax=Melastoma candidum TaxID=119954 RepID=A0ACB9LLI7_9MYRT|nr:hypothetical protein MLD38_037247 [Melastoma candidum]
MTSLNPIQVDYEIGARILHYIRSEKSLTVKLSPIRTLIGKPITPRVAFLSSRGPNYIAPAILKPDITAPGVNILAAVPSIFDKADNGYAILSMTSMSTLHVAGIVAILKSLHPDWSPGAIRSAMVTTASVESSGQLIASCDGLSDQVHVIYLGGRQRTDGTEKELHRKLLTSVLGSNEKVDEAIVYSYKWGFSGFAAKITEAQAQRLSELPEVIKVLPNTVHRMQTTRSWDFLGVPDLHAPSSSLNQSNHGDGVIIGILDTGQDVFDTEELDGIAVGSLHAIMEGITVVCAAEHSRHPLLSETMKLFGDKPFTLESRSIGFESSTFMPDFLAYENDSTSDRGCDAEKFRVIAANFKCHMDWSVLALGIASTLLVESSSFPSGQRNRDQRD